MHQGKNVLLTSKSTYYPALAIFKQMLIFFFTGNLPLICTLIGGKIR